MIGADRIRAAGAAAVERIEMARLLAKSALDNACRPPELYPSAEIIDPPVDLYQGCDPAWLDAFIDQLIADA